MKVSYSKLLCEVTATLIKAVYVFWYKYKETLIVAAHKGGDKNQMQHYVNQKDHNRRCP